MTFQPNAGRNPHSVAAEVLYPAQPAKARWDFVFARLPNN